MDHKVINLIKWLFLAIGGGMLVAANRTDLPSKPVLFIIGIALMVVGGGIIAYSWWSKKEEAALRQSGQLIYAEFQQVEQNKALEVNGSHPFRVVAQWHDITSNTVYVFRSTNLWFDPTRYVESRSIPVYVDLNKPSRYHVDLSFLPNVHA